MLSSLAHDLMFPSRCNLYLRSSWILHSLLWYFVPTFRDNVSVFSDCLTLQYGTDSLSRVPNCATSQKSDDFFSCLVKNEPNINNTSFTIIIIIVVIFTYLLTHSMVQSSSWEANWFAASQEIPRISRNPKVHYRTHKRPPPVSILDQPNPVHIPTSHLLEIHPNIILPSMLESPKWSLKWTCLIQAIVIIIIIMFQNTYHSNCYWGAVCYVSHH